MASILAAIFNVVVALLVPLGVFAWYIAKRRSLVLPFVIGAATFFLSQMVLRIPLMQLLATRAWYMAFAGAHPVVYSLLVGLSAGVFEEVGRYIAMLIMKWHRGWGDAVAFGVGHGGIEAILLVGVNYLLSLLLATGAITALPASAVLAAGAERAFTMLFHVGASVMVMRAVQARQPLWLVLAILVHGVLDGMLGILQMWGWGMLAIEAYIAVFGLGMLAFTLLMRPKMQNTVTEGLTDEKTV